MRKKRPRLSLADRPGLDRRKYTEQANPRAELPETRSGQAESRTDVADCAKMKIRKRPHPHQDWL